ncbi:MAG: DUF4295 family protein [Solirubrobacteraceae bacterium]
MAKKTVATLQGSAKKMTKVIRMIKSPTNGSYYFEEKVVNAEDAETAFKK